LLWRTVGRNPAAADHENDRGAIGVLLRFYDIEGQRQTVFVAIDNIWNDVDLWLGLRRGLSKSPCSGAGEYDQDQENYPLNCLHIYPHKNVAGGRQSVFYSVESAVLGNLSQSGPKPVISDDALIGRRDWIKRSASLGGMRLACPPGFNSITSRRQVK